MDLNDHRTERKDEPLSGFATPLVIATTGTMFLTCVSFYLGASFALGGPLSPANVSFAIENAFLWGGIGTLINFISISMNRMRSRDPMPFAVAFAIGWSIVTGGGFLIYVAGIAGC